MLDINEQPVRPNLDLFVLRIGLFLIQNLLYGLDLSHNARRLARQHPARNGCLEGHVVEGDDAPYAGRVVVGPTIIGSGRIIAPTGGQYRNLLQPEKRDLAIPEYLFADTRDELKKAVRENILYGAKVIKIVVDDQPYIYSVEDIKFVVEEAAKAGLKVAAHCATEQGARNASQAGVASIEHGFVMSNETLELAKRNNVFLVGTDFTELVFKAYGSPALAHAAIVDRLRRAYRIGVPIAFGSDVVVDVQGYTRGSISLSLIESFVEAGIPPKAILQMITTNGARLLGVEKERGAIRPGYAADIIATQQNPLDDISALKQVKFVMKDGKVFRNQ